MNSPFPVVDGLCLLPVDYDDFRKAGLTAALTDVSVVTLPDGSVSAARTYDALLKNMTAVRRQLDRTAEVFLGLSARDVERAHATGTTGLFFQIQGADPLETDLDRLPVLYELGLRVLQLTHNGDNALAGGAMRSTWTGLTPLGHEGVGRMQEMGILVDLSHASDLTVRDTVGTAQKPVIVSHTGPRALVNSARCIPDDLVKEIARTGGVVGIFMMSMFVTPDDEATTDGFIRAVRHIANMGGIDSVSIGNDYPPAGSPHGPQDYTSWFTSLGEQGVLGFDRPPRHAVFPELNNLDRIRSLAQRLDQAGFSDAEIEKVLGGNLVRVLRDAL